MIASLFEARPTSCAPTTRAPPTVRSSCSRPRHHHPSPKHVSTRTPKHNSTINVCYHELHAGTNRLLLAADTSTCLPRSTPRFTRRSARWARSSRLPASRVPAMTSSSTYVFHHGQASKICRGLQELNRASLTAFYSCTLTLRLPRARTSARLRSLACSTLLYVPSILINLQTSPLRSRPPLNDTPSTSGRAMHFTHIAYTSADILQGKAKYNKWQEAVNAGLSQKDAEDKYIELGNELLKKHDN